VIAVLARRADGEIRYRIVDEYEETYVTAVERSREPLTLGEMLGLLDHSHHPDAPIAEVAYGMVEGLWEHDFRMGDSPEDVIKFVSPSSPFYPLADYYAARAAGWVAISERNPLGPEIIAALRDSWHRASEERRKTVAEFLQSHGYESEMFEKYGARDLGTVQSLIGD
jgi:hypothetical protein